MGFGLPAAIAAKLARPDLPVVAIIGDGCFQMTCGEVAVARRLGLTLPIVVLDDRWLALIKVKQERRNYPYVGTELAGRLRRPRIISACPPSPCARPWSSRMRSAARLPAPGPTVIEAAVDAAHSYSETVYD